MDIKNWHAETLGEKAVNALEKNGFKAVYFSDKNVAAQYVLEFINDGMKVGIGGSVTLEELSLPAKAAKKGAVVLNHNVAHLTPEEKLEIRRQQLLSDVFLCSANGITLDGYLVNIDASGNRIGAMTFGPKKVIVVAGVNKICKDVDSAFNRIETVAAPQNNKRLNRPNPCVATGYCMDCKGATRICKIYSVIKRKPTETDLEVVLVGESLGY
ncbi:MAG: lactate utilization protein C [Peptococcaceae bacterium BICA1-8]|nr:MAG: lactate utilization protein C [Peptococcaceae bacterium BICA1-8]